MISIPFSGTKKKVYKYIKPIVKENGYTKIYEPFGGSCVLSVNLFNDGVIGQAFINDYDNTFGLYPEYLDIKDELVKKCAKVGIKKQKDRNLTEDKAKLLQDFVSEIDPKYWDLLGHNFCFSASVASGNIKLNSFKYVRGDLTTDKAREYLNVVNQLERTSLDFEDYFNKYMNDFDENSLIIVDPPYMNCSQAQYKNQTFFSLTDTVRLMKLLQKSNCDFIFFNVIEDDVHTLLDLFDFPDREIIVYQSSMCSGNHYDNILAYVKNNSPLEEEFSRAQGTIKI